MQEIVGKIFLENVALVATTNDELGDTVGGVNLHDVPENRTPANRDHGLWLVHRLFAQSSAEPTGQYDRFQLIPRSVIRQPRAADLLKNQNDGRHNNRCNRQQQTYIPLATGSSKS
jgi:hypothetical protein